LGGAVGDELYFEQYLPLVGGELRAFGDHVRALFNATGSAGPTEGEGKLSLQYVDADRVATGNATSSTVNGTAFPQQLGAYANAQYDESPPADAHELRVRIGARRRATGTQTHITFNEVRRMHALERLMLAEQSLPGDWAPGLIYQAFGEIMITPSGGMIGGVDYTGQLRVGPDYVRIATSGDLFLEAGGSLMLTETTTPPVLPDSGYYAVYPKTDHHLYGMDDSGNEYQLDSAGGGGGTATRRFAFFAS
jgi:hypothetical protein